MRLFGGFKLFDTCLMRLFVDFRCVCFVWYFIVVVCCCLTVVRVFDEVC